jgi:hypothetical protein
MAGWVTVYYTVPSTGTISLSTLISYIDESIENNMSSGTTPSTLRGCATFYGVSTSGTISMSDFRGEQIPRYQFYNGGGGGGLEP